LRSEQFCVDLTWLASAFFLIAAVPKEALMKTSKTLMLGTLFCFAVASAWVGSAWMVRTQLFAAENEKTPGTETPTLEKKAPPKRRPPQKACPQSNLVPRSRHQLRSILRSRHRPRSCQGHPAAAVPDQPRYVQLLWNLFAAMENIANCLVV